MKWFHCRRRRPDISLLVADALAGEQKLELETHLAACQECRYYFNEMRTLTAPLTDWEKNLSAIETTPAARLRWARAVREADQSAAVRQPLLKNVWRIVWFELIWPSRRAWAGMAALWLVMLAVNGRLSDHQTPGVRASSSQELMQAREEQNRVLAELIQPTFALPASPAIPPRPRSERERDWDIV